MRNKLIFEEEARQKIKSGASQVAEAVKKTLGPRGKNIIIQRPPLPPLVTNDGVTIARDIHLQDEFEDMGAQLIKEAALKTNDVAGDGTTTAIVLADAMITEGVKVISAGADPMAIKRGMEAALNKLRANLTAQAIKIETPEQLAQVATISANNDEVLGKLIGELVHAVGPDGVITMDGSEDANTTTEIIEGIELPSGMASPYFVTEQTKAVAELNAANKPVRILLTTNGISANSDIVPFLQKMMEAQEKILLIVADHFSDDAMKTLIVNKLQGNLQVICVKAPSIGQNRLDILEDIAAATGATVIDRDKGMSIAEATLDQSGFCTKVVSTDRKTTIIGAQGDKKVLEARLTELRAKQANEKKQFNKDQIGQRIASLTTGVGVIKVGAISDVEREEKMMRVEDAKEAAKAAFAEGVVMGGGGALMLAASNIENIPFNDEGIGWDIVTDAAEAPMKQIAINASVEPGKIIEKFLPDSTVDTRMVWNAATNEMVDYMKAGIIDPLKVTRTALENAVSIAAQILTMGGAITQFDETKLDK